MVACAVGLAGCFSPAFSVAVAPRQIVLDCQTLGEYQSTVRRISIMRVRDSAVIWRIDAPSGHFQVNTVTFRAGLNPRVPEFGLMNAGTVIQPDAAEFLLEDGVEYQIAAWDEDLSKPSVSKRFLFPVKH